MSRRFLILLTAVSVVATATIAVAKLPSWDVVKPAKARFKVLAAFNDLAVVDKETGLVWEKSWNSTANWRNAMRLCGLRTTGGRAGWRLPTVEELTSVIDPAESTPALPTGHPFDNLAFGTTYWSANEDESDDSTVVTVNFDLFNLSTTAKSTTRPFVCVRGGRGSGTPSRAGL